MKMEKIINVIVEGGKASAGPPLGPALGPMGINAGEVVTKINEDTKSFQGMKIPVKVIIDTETKSFEVEVGSPATSELIKKEIGIEKGRKEKGEIVGDIKLEKIIEIAKKKFNSSLGRNIKNVSKEIVGSCTSLGVTVNGLATRDIIIEINDGKHDSLMG